MTTANSVYLGIALRIAGGKVDEASTNALVLVMLRHGPEVFIMVISWLELMTRRALVR
jgi:hypothetical protein